MSSADERIINRLQRIYDAQGAGGASFEELTGEPSDNAALGAALDAKGPVPSDTAYDATTWNGVATIAPSKNAVRDKLVTVDAEIATKTAFLDTAGAPDNGVGANGDYAFDDATKTIYGPKAGGVWPAGVVLGGGGYTTTVTAGGTTTLTAADTYAQFFTGASFQICKLPVTSTLSLGFQFLLVNNSSGGSITVRTSGNNVLLTLAGGDWAIVTCILTSGTGIASWSASETSVGYARLASPEFTGTPLAPTQSALDNSTKLATTAYADSAATSAAALVASSGTYSPAASDSVNLDANPTCSVAQWLRVGNTVTVSGQLSIDITASATTTSFRMTLPVASNFSGVFEAGGTAASVLVAGQVAAIKARAGGDVTFEWVSTGTAAQEMFYSFTYLVAP